MTMRARAGGLEPYPDDEAEDKVLVDFTQSDESAYGYAYNRTLGDLLVDMCSDLPGGPIQNGDNEPENWESLEHALMMSAVVQLKAANFCAAYATDVPDDTSQHHAPTLNQEELARLLGGIAKRLQAGAELSARLRRARWGHPNFGGGEGWEQRKGTLKKSEVKR